MSRKRRRSKGKTPFQEAMRLMGVLRREAYRDDADRAKIAGLERKIDRLLGS